MTTFGSNFELPAGLTEADVIDLVDGKLSAAREPVVLAALKAEPRLALLVRQMREDEAGVALLRQVSVPGDLGDRVEAALQAQALRDLAAQEAEAPAEAVVASVVTVRQVGEHDGWRVFLERGWPMRLATAASIAIVAGVGYLGYREYQGSVVKPGPDIATTGPTTPETRGPEEPATTVATNETPGEPAPIEGPMPETAVAAAEVLTPEKAIELARQGRLVISVRLPSAGPETMRRVEAIARAAGREGGWRPMAMNQLPPAYAGLLTPSIAASDVATPTPNQPAVASDGPGHASATTPPSAPAKRPVVVAIYSVELSPKGATLQGLLDALSPGRPEGAVLRVVEAPMSPPPAVTPEDVLWWQNPPATWGLKVRVPVVVEGLE